MKQEYRHTKPYRGKDPNFEKEELTEQKTDLTCGLALLNPALPRLKINRKLKKIFDKL
jgi:hypothetical protein